MDILLGFEVHQPLRFRSNFHWDHYEFMPVRHGELARYYFGFGTDKEVLRRTSERCYFPSNRILLEEIDRHRSGGKRAKFFFSISGVFLEQCEMWNSELLNSFRALAETGCVEFLDQTYYHSVASLWQDPTEWLEQVGQHRRAMKELLGVEPRVFENTELLYNNRIARLVEEMGYEGIVAEGTEKVLSWRSPNYVYRPRSCPMLKVLLRNYRLTDDFGFRFGLRSWDRHPLTADKFVSWLASSTGQCIVLFSDYETFGEHHWPESGIHEFLRHLPREILNRESLSMETPTESLRKNEAVGELDVDELSGTISWADTERDTSAWLGNSMQWAYHREMESLRHIVREGGDEELIRVWRLLQTSDHLYYMSTKEGGPGEVHKYFSPYGSPTDAFITGMTILSDLRARLSERVGAGRYAFALRLDSEDSVTVYSLKAMIETLKSAQPEQVAEHQERADLAAWAEHSLLDESLAGTLRKIRLNGSPAVVKARVLFALKARLRRILSRSALRIPVPVPEEVAGTSPMMARRILRTVPIWKAFWFSEGEGMETSWHASSLEEFHSHLSIVHVRSISFHLSRGDFSKWIVDVLGDQDLADRIAKLEALDHTSLTVHQNLANTVGERIGALRNLAPPA